MTAAELGEVLLILLNKHPDLNAEAEAIAAALMTAPSVGDVASKVFDAVTGMGIEAFHGRAGKQPRGYAERSEAAWDLLGEAVGDVIDDMKRRMDIGTESDAEAICLGIVLALHEVEGAGPDGLLGWAPDFPVDEACHAVAELIRACPAGKRAAVRKRLLEKIGDGVPEWHDMLCEEADRALRGK